LCKKWILAIKRRDFVPNERSIICSDHFESTSFVQSGWSSKRALSQDAVPSIFPGFPPHLQPKVINQRRIIIKHKEQKATNR
jgi:hypothetical protein